MALSGTFQNYPVSSFGLYCEWSGAQSVTGNYTDVTLKVYLSYYTLDVGARSDSTISINGVSETYTVPAIEDYSSGWKKKLLKTKTVRVSHNADGTKSGVALSASWRFSGTYSGVSVGTITDSTTVTLNSIDRSAPTVSCSVSGITANGFKISASSSATADIWQYSLNGGSTWTQFSSTAGTSASVTLSTLSPNTTYSVRVRARKRTNQVYGTSSTVSAKTLGGAVLLSCGSFSADAASISLSLRVTVYNAAYTNYITIKNGSTTYLSLAGRIWSAGTANRTITLTSSERTTLLNAMASVKSFTATIELVTKSGSTQIGSASTCTCTIRTSQANSGPSISGFTFADSYSTTTAITDNDQVLIQDYSRLTVTPGTAAARNGASIVSYSAVCSGVTKSNTTGAALSLGTIGTSGTRDITLTVTDSRGYTASVTQSVTVVPYSKPRVSSVSLRRTNDIETEMQLVFNGSISPITVDGTQKNSLLYARYRYKLTSASSYNSYTNILGSVTATSSSFSFSNLELCNLDSESSYDFHLQIRDQLNSLTSLDLYFVVSQGTPLVALRKKMVGINTPSPETALHVVGDTRIEGTLTPDEVDGWDPDEDDARGNEDEDSDAEGDAEGEDSESSADLGPEVEMDRYYTVNRVLRVQPDTGVIVHGAEEVWMYYARDDEEAAEIYEDDNREAELANPTRTAIYYPGEFNDETHENQMTRAKDGLSTLTTMGTIIPWGAGIIGLILLVIGFILNRSAGKHRS